MLTVLNSVIVIGVCGFWSIFPFATECIGSCCLCTWSVDYSKVKRREELRPADLTLTKSFCSSEVFEIFVIRDDFKWLPCAL